MHADEQFTQDGSLVDASLRDALAASLAALVDATAPELPVAA